MKKFIITHLFIIVIFSANLFAQPSATYYNNAEGKTGVQLRIALFQIISPHTNVGYGGLYDVYETSDVTPDGKVWDMYSTCVWIPNVKKCGSYSNVCDCYNREHSIPQSWFNEANPMVADAFHVYPTDGKVNGQRSNHPFGECANGVKCDNNAHALGKLGTSTFSGYSSTVFEPDDEYKGDFARTYFYMATCYADKNFTSGQGDVVFTYSSSGNPKCNLTNYAVNLFLKWSRQDPVSQKEIDRNNAIDNHQHNRNPFIDFPELGEYIWGDSIGYVWHSNSPSAIEEVKFSTLEIYPNPVETELVVSGQWLVVSDVQIFDITGKTVLATHYSLLTTNSIDVSNLPQGLYFIKINNQIGKFIKK
ncbi:MAG: endonuclease [Prevotellaceae bacterium]|jgi:endonuclease I|nr:endonuclease [Prevotellaceae bacterium]